jgi:predicted transcriptional regulator YdeE
MMDQTTGGTDERDHFIPARKIDVLDAVIADGALGSEPEQEQFRQLCKLLGAIYHFQYFEQLERLRNDYFYFSPDTDGHARFDSATVERAYTDLIDALTKVLHGANFVEVSHEEIERAHREHGIVRVNIRAPLEEYREVRFFRRGHHNETVEISKWFGFGKRTVEFGVYDDIVLLVTMKPADAGKKRGKKPKVRPGAVLLKYFRDIASADLNALFPDVKVVMGIRDRLMLGVPALIGGVPILLKLASTLTVLFLVAGFYLGLSNAVRDEEMAGALAAISGLIALGGFMVTQYMRFQRQSLVHQKILSDNVYYRNINNNAGIFDYIVGEAEEQECKEAFLAYYFLLKDSAPTEDALDRHIEAWIQKTFGADVDFECDDALAKLDRLGLLKRNGDKLSVLPLDEALISLDRIWDNFFPFDSKPKATTG